MRFPLCLVLAVGLALPSLCVGESANETEEGATLHEKLARMQARQNLGLPPVEFKTKSIVAAETSAAEAMPFDPRVETVTVVGWSGPEKTKAAERLDKTLAVLGRAAKVYSFYHILKGRDQERHLFAPESCWGGQVGCPPLRAE